MLLDHRVVVCARVFRTSAEHARGLSGEHPPAAGAFVNRPQQAVQLWMHDVHRDLVAVWVGSGGSILGSVRMRAMTETLHPSPGAVPLILELSPSLWSAHSAARSALLGGRCRS